MNDKTSDIISFIEKLDTSEPGLYVVKCNVALSTKHRDAITSYIEGRINDYAPGSKVIILDGFFEAINIEKIDEGVGGVENQQDSLQ